MRIGYLTADNAKDKKKWSGIHYFILQSLQTYCSEVIFIGPVKTVIFDFLFKLCNRILYLIFRKQYNFKHGIFLSKYYACIFNRRIKKQNLDLIFAANASTEIAYLKTNVPVIYLSGTTFHLLAEYYPELKNLFSLSLKIGNYIEERAIRKADSLIYPSRWAVDSAINDYHAVKEKINIVQYGANIENIPTRDAIFSRKKKDKWEILFIGVHWERKGGNIAYEAFKELQRMGLDVNLTICGCIPPANIDLQNIIVIPYLDKENRDQYSILEELYCNSDFLLLPTRAEVAGIVFCEASAFGIPIITTDTGGVSSLVMEGVNGFLLPYNAPGKEYAKKINSLCISESNYQKFRQSCRDCFETNLNWEVWGQTVNLIINNMLNTSED